MTKLLYFQWSSFMNAGIERALHKLGIDYDPFFYQFKDWEKDEKFEGLFEEKIKKGIYSTVFSVNFSPLISDICEKYQIVYISWIYDSPVHIRNLESMKNECNRNFLFDRGLVEQYKKMGIQAKHLPLAVDTELFLKTARAEAGKYTAEVAMVGQLYQTQYPYFMAPLSEYQRGYFEGMLNAQMRLYGAYMIPEWITEEILDEINAVYAKASADHFKMGRKELEFLLAQEVTGRERYLALSILSSRFQVKNYSNDKSDQLKRVEFCGYADYYTQMPAIFAESKINLNISLRTIQSGITLRVLDILGCGGFAISNYQSEIEEYFQIGQEIEVYTSLEELLEKTEFYLKHETLRTRIAQAGLARVQRDFSFEERIKEMFLNRSV